MSTIILVDYAWLMQVHKNFHIAMRPKFQWPRIDFQKMVTWMGTLADLESIAGVFMFYAAPYQSERPNEREAQATLQFQKTRSWLQDHKAIYRGAEVPYYMGWNETGQVKSTLIPYQLTEQDIRRHLDDGAISEKVLSILKGMRIQVRHLVQKGVDTRFCNRIFEAANDPEIDHIVVVAGDADLAYGTGVALSKGKKVTLLSCADENLNMGYSRAFTGQLMEYPNTMKIVLLNEARRVPTADKNGTEEVIPLMEMSRDNARPFEHRRAG